MHRLSPILVFLALAGCSAPDSGASVVDFGSRNVPGGRISVAAPAAIRLDAGNHFHIGFTGTATAVSVGLDWPDGTGDCAVAQLVSPGRWAIALTLPATLPPGAVLRVQVRLADGALVESGYNDFRL